MINLNLLTHEEAIKIHQLLSQKGVPANNRVLLATTDDTTTSSGILIPKTVKDDVPKKGVVVNMGIIPTQEEYNMYSNIHIGSVVTYGLYAGKEVEFDISELGIEKSIIFRVLSLNEIIYIEKPIEDENREV